MTRCGPSQGPEEACWFPSLNILGGGDILPALDLCPSDTNKILTGKSVGLAQQA